ncbi:MAG: ABC transporter ATP-binding protein/permease [Candidatus Omnitrophica bacterium]|nr:ABC transporter ATP-binding protein/permease [Candidatus Omnitrophota bacterium]MBU2266418.1 ABC transporter ATP-binding protein/permease [Candidatus Omnitrophota bacterium]
MDEQLHKELLVKDNTKQLVQLLKRFKGIVILIAFFGIGVSLTEGFGVTIVIPLLDGAAGPKIVPLPYPFSLVSSFFVDMGLKQKIQTIAAFMIIIISLKSFLTYMGNILVNRLQQNSIKYYRMLCFEQLMKFKIGYFNLQRLGHIQSLIITNANHVGVLIGNIGNIVPKLLTILLLLSMLFVLSWKMTILAVVLVVLASSILKGLSRRAAASGKASDLAVKNLTSTLLDALTGMKTIHLFNRENDTINRFDKDAEEYRKKVFSLVKAKDLVKPFFEFIAVSSLALVMIAGSFALQHYGESSIQVLLVFLFIFFRILPSANAFNSIRVSIIGYWPFLNRIHQFIQEKESLYIPNGSKCFSGLKKEIEIKDLSFQYNSGENVVLSDVSLSITKGLKVGIVGPSGGGKSTIVELLLRFYDPQKGQILIDGVDLRELDLNFWRRSIGVVSQDTFLFNDTVQANIAFAKPGASKEEIETAAQRAHVSEFIKELPKGYDTLLGERGVRLSGGQRQRIAIARAILTEPEILVFDEATSSLDTESERIVQQALDYIAKGRTVITIAHRLSTVLDADRIFVVSGGCLVQQGTHQELLEQKGVYHRLVCLQALGSDYR